MPHKYAPDRKFTSLVEIIGRDLLCAEAKLVRKPERRKMCHQRMSGINSSRRGSVRVSTEGPTSTSLSPSSPVDRAQNVSREVSKRPMTTKNLENAICSRIGSARYRGVPMEAEFEGCNARGYGPAQMRTSGPLNSCIGVLLSVGIAND